MKLFVDPALAIGEVGMTDTPRLNPTSTEHEYFANAGVLQRFQGLISDVGAGRFLGVNGFAAAR